jgi:hypothetical protein
MKDNWATMNGFYDRFNIIELAMTKKEKNSKEKNKKVQK